MIDPSNMIGAAVERGVISVHDANQLRAELQDDQLRFGNYQLHCTMDSIRRVPPHEWLTKQDGLVGSGVVAAVAVDSSPQITIGTVANTTKYFGHTANAEVTPPDTIVARATAKSSHGQPD